MAESSRLSIQQSKSAEEYSGEELPTVSAVIPAYNAADTIERALDSVYAQTYPNITEVIVVDDGSTDATAQIVRRDFPDVKLIQQENAGVSAARNRGIEAAQGEYIAFLDADDEWLPRKVERQTSVLESDPTIDYCGCLLELGTPKRGRLRPYPERPSHIISLQFLPFLRKKKEYPPITCSPIARAQSIRAVGGFDETLVAFVDYDLWLRVLAQGHSLVVLQEYLEIWYLYKESVSHGRRGLAKHDCALRILDKWDPANVPKARKLITPAEHARVKLRRLLAASCDYAIHGEYGSARRYAAQALQLLPGGIWKEPKLLLLANWPAVYGSVSRLIATAKSVFWSGAVLAADGIELARRAFGDKEGGGEAGRR